MPNKTQEVICNPPENTCTCTIISDIQRKSKGGVPEHWIRIITPSGRNILAQEQTDGTYIEKILIH